jgi:hypothetical protein
VTRLDWAQIGAGVALLGVGVWVLAAPDGIGEPEVPGWVCPRGVVEPRTVFGVPGDYPCLDPDSGSVVVVHAGGRQRCDQYGYLMRDDAEVVVLP